MAPSHSKQSGDETRSLNPARTLSEEYAAGETAGRRWVREIVDSIRSTFSKQRLEGLTDACLEPSVQALLDAISMITSSLPMWFQQWFKFAVFSAFEQRPLRTTLPLFVVGTIIGILYVGFVNIYLPFAGYSFTSPLSVCFHALLVLASVSYYKGVVTDPGEIPESWTTLPNVAASRLIEKKKSSGDFRWCQKENKYKPDRAHFCTPMNRNVLRMDHYCPWLSTCVGYYNHKYFFLFLLYTTISTNMVGLSLAKLLWSTWLTAGHTFLAWEVECLAGLLSVVITPFFGFHCWLMSRNMTTIEFCEKRRDHAKDARSPYDINLYHNMKCVLGSNPLAWFLPIDGGLGDGLVFDVNRDWDGKESPEDTGKHIVRERQSGWTELFDDVHRTCNDVHSVTVEAATRFYNLFAGIKQ